MSVLQTKTEQGGEWEPMLQVSRKTRLTEYAGFGDGSTLGLCISN